MKKIILSLLLFSFAFSYGQQWPAYRIYSKAGKPVGAEFMAKKLSKYDVVLFGELHNNSINHWLQLRLAKSLFKHKKDRLVLGAEMFERDNQTGLNGYLAGKLPAKQLTDSVRLWNNFVTDYKPLLDFAKKEKLDFVATNVPRRYASQVAKQGLASLDTLPQPDKRWIAQLPITVSLKTPGYAAMKKMMGDHADGKQIMNFVAAQAIKDATMAESISNNRRGEQLFLHFNGDYHSKEYGGIYWYLKQQNPALKIAVISIFETEDQNLAMPTGVVTEFNLVLPADMIRTYE